MARLTSEELNRIKEKHGVNKIWSFSRMNTFITSKYEYFLKYVKHQNEDRNDSCYCSLGTISHDTLDDYYEGKITYEDMIDRFEDGWATCIDIAQLKFDRTDEVKNERLAVNYKNNLLHFFEHHSKYDNKLLIEKPVTVNVNGNIFVGYIDAMFKDKNEDIHIIDFKTSSMYKGKALLEHSKQLLLYKLGIHQMSGIPFDKIHICFNFLKYVTIEYQQKNGAIKTRNVERSKIGESLQSNAKTWLKAFGYDVDEYLKLLLDTNSIDCLPDEVKEKYAIKDCHCYVESNEEIIDKLKDDITTTIQDIEMRESDYNETSSDRCFWDSEESIKSQSYYFANLSGYSANLHLPYKAYLERLEAASNGEDMFAGVGSNDESATSKDIHQTENNGDIDLSWLNNI